MKITAKFILLFLLSAKIVYADSFMDRCQLYFIRNFVSKPQLPLDLNEAQMEKRFINIAFKVIRKQTAPNYFFRKYERVINYQIIKNILDNNPSSDLKRRIAQLSAKVYWEEFGPLILMNLLETNPNIQVQKQIVLSITNMHSNAILNLTPIRNISKSIAPDMSFEISDYFRINSSENELLKMRMRVLEKLLDKKPPPVVQKSIAHSLGQIQHSIGAYLLEVMFKTNPVMDVVEEMTRSAGFIESAKGVPLLIMISKKYPSNQPLQLVIIQSVANIGSDGLPVLEIMLEQDLRFEIALEIAYYVGLLSQGNGTLMLSKTLKHSSFSSEEKQNILNAYFSGKNEAHRSTDNGNNKEGSDKFDPPSFAPLLF